MKYRVTISDNFHYMDEGEYMDGGEFDSYDEALAKAHAVIEASLRDGWEKGFSADDLMARYVMFGDDAFIIPSEQPRFSGRDYARSRAEAICREREGEPPRSETP